MLNSKKITLIIPCKNEEAALYWMLKNKPSYIDEVIVVDNESEDNTDTVAYLLGTKVVYEPRQIGGIGYGFAHQTGMKLSTGDIIVAMDGDGTYPLTNIKDAISYLEKSNSDFVSCSRFPLTNPKAISFTRQIGVLLLNFLVGFLYKYQIKDILSGMWIMKRGCIEKLELSSGGWNFSPEIKLAAIAHPDIHFSECHIPHYERLNGISKQQILKTGFAHLRFILKHRFIVNKLVLGQPTQSLTDQLLNFVKATLHL